MPFYAIHFCQSLLTVILISFLRKLYIRFINIFCLLPLKSISEEKFEDKNLSQRECKSKIDKDPLPEVEPWYFYPINTECYHFAIWEYMKMNMSKWSQKSQWFTAICNKIHKNYAIMRARNLRKTLKKTFCVSGI